MITQRPLSNPVRVRFRTGQAVSFFYKAGEPTT